MKSSIIIKSCFICCVKLNSSCWCHVMHPLWITMTFFFLICRNNNYNLCLSCDWSLTQRVCLFGSAVAFQRWRSHPGFHPNKYQHCCQKTVPGCVIFSWETFPSHSDKVEPENRTLEWKGGSFIYMKQTLYKKETKVVLSVGVKGDVEGGFVSSACIKVLFKTGCCTTTATSTASPAATPAPVHA